MTKTQLYGTWDSPISARTMAGNIRLNDVQWDTDGQTLVWSETRAGRGVLVMQRGSDAPRDLTDNNLSVRGRVGYGGGDFSVARGHVTFAADGGRLYRVALDGGTPTPITPAFGAAAAPSVSPDGQWVVFVHSYEEDDCLALVDAAGVHYPVKLAQGDDFVMQPSWHPAGSHIAYIAWNHPQMPWLGAELRLLTLEQGAAGRPPHVSASQTLAGNTQVAVYQPQFSPDGRRLAYASDASGFWQLYLYDLTTATHQQITSAAAEHAIPAWIQGTRMFGWNQDGSALFYLRSKNGSYSAHVYDVDHASSIQLHDLDTYTYLAQIAVAPDESLAFIAGNTTTPDRIIHHHDEAGTRIVRRSNTEALIREDIAAGQHITWTGADDEPVHGIYYEPQNSAYEGSGDPPLIVMVHGGPTSQRELSYQPGVQFFTSRGFAVLQPNYRGSTGYGREYVDAHEGNWGVHDVEDSATGAEYLADLGYVDRKKLVIMGGSAGGYTVLLSLVTKPGFYAAGISSYGVADLFALVRDTHKFEARYGDWLVGPLPEAAEQYRERSPLFHADHIEDPVAIFQGSEDRVVPPNQAEGIVAALRRRGVPHVYHLFEGEGHGWRQPTTIERYYEAVMDFLLTYVVYR